MCRRHYHHSSLHTTSVEQRWSESSSNDDSNSGRSQSISRRVAKSSQTSKRKMAVLISARQYLTSYLHVISSLPTPKMVFIIGGGPSGLVTLRNLVELSNFERVGLVEQMNHVGGVWFVNLSVIILSLGTTTATSLASFRPATSSSLESTKSTLCLASRSTYRQQPRAAVLWPRHGQTTARFRIRRPPRLVPNSQSATSTAQCTSIHLLLSFQRNTLQISSLRVDNAQNPTSAPYKK